MYMCIQTDKTQSLYIYLHHLVLIRKSICSLTPHAPSLIRHGYVLDAGHALDADADCCKFEGD